jgi:hypothetical protein
MVVLKVWPEFATSLGGSGNGPNLFNKKTDFHLDVLFGILGIVSSK